MSNSNNTASVVVKTLKTYLGEDLRRYPVQAGRLPPLAELKAQLARDYQVNIARVQWVDEDSEKVTATSDADLVEAVRVSQEQGQSVVRLHIVADTSAAAPAAAATPSASSSETKSESAKAPPAVTIETPRASIPTPSPVAPKKSAAAAEPRPTGDSVLALLRGFFAEPGMQAALPSAVCLFLDTVVQQNDNPDLGAAIRFVLDAFPILKASPLVQLGLTYLDAGLPYLEVAFAPLRELLVVMGAQGVQGLKGTVTLFAPLAFGFITQALQAADGALLEQIFAQARDWAQSDMTAPFPWHEIKAKVCSKACPAGAGGAGAAPFFGGFGGPCGRGFGGWGGRGFGGRGPFGHPHGPHGGPHAHPHHGHPFAGHPFAGSFGGRFGGRGGCGRREQAESSQTEQQQQTSNPVADLLAAFGLEQSAEKPSQPESASASASSEPAEVVHTHVSCDGPGCGQTPIKGLRFKCSVCPDYDLCSSCEAKGVHPAEHPLLKFTAPQERVGRGGPCGRGAWRHPFQHGFQHGHGGFRAWRDQQKQGETADAPSARFVQDVTIPDRSTIPAGSVQVKRWLVQNDGSSAWPAGTKLIFVRGDREFVDSEEFSVPLARAGEQVEVAAVLKAPAIAGRYQAFFRLATADRTPFGVRLWVDAFVTAEKPQSASAPAPVQQPTTTPVAAESESALPALELPVPITKSLPVLKEAPAYSAAAFAQGSSSSSSAPSAPSASAPAVERSAREHALEVLAAMGFLNTELNNFLLESNDNNVQAVCQWLLEKTKA